MHTVKGETQSIAREINRKLVIDLLRKHELSCTDMAGILNLSHTAIAKILRELESYEIIVSSNKVISNGAGRRKLNYALNVDVGIVVVVNYAQKQLLVVDIKGNILYRTTMEPVEKINISYINETITLIKDVLNQRFSKSQLLSICIATIGMVHPETNEFIYALNIEDYRNINLRKIFKEHFDTEICVKNDINLALLGEKQAGYLAANYTNGIAVYIEDSVGSGLMLNKGLYEGSRGFAGEIGLFTYETGERLEKLVSCKTIMQKLNQSGPKKYTDFDDVANDYINGNPLVEQIVNDSVVVLAKSFKNILELLDLDIIVLTGMITKLGYKYLEQIRNFIAQYEYLSCEIVFSKLGNEVINIGAINEGITMGINKIIEDRKCSISA
ncbi:MAG: ROK family transcriptional regulator [Bacilli bacterium]|nr:ROK family transcriptional regulator [Bacilli bacterium]